MQTRRGRIDEEIRSARLATDEQREQAAGGPQNDAVASSVNDAQSDPP
jgi:hypothetical protein